MTSTPRDPDFEQRIRSSFGRQAAMATVGATLARVTPGEVVLDLPFRPALTQQHGFLHAGIVTTVMDSACGYAALTLMQPGAAVLTVEFKVNLLSPARGKRFCAIGRVVRAGRTVTVVSGEFRVVEPADDAQPKPAEDTTGALVAIMTGTMMAVADRPGLVD
ncbi:MAG: PaaI family thioesterase [Polyangiaceae bacterium]|nr:PaaI family thioesterase [Polyangiaceae bacterium]